MLDCTFITQNPQLSKWAHLLFFCRNRSCHSYQILWHHFYDDKNVNIKKLKVFTWAIGENLFTIFHSMHIMNDKKRCFILYSPSRILRFSNRWIYCKIKQTLKFSQKLANFQNSRKIFAYFGLRRTPWRHRNAHSVWTMKWTACVLLMTDLQELHQTNEPKAERIRATRLGYIPFICSGHSRGLLSIARHRYTQHSEIQWRN